MSIANVLEEGEPITPQRLFRMRRPQRLDGFNRLTMDIDGLDPQAVDPQAVDPQAASHSASLGVLADDILGFTLWDRRGERAGLVTTDLSLDFVTPTGWLGPELHADGRVVSVTRDGGVSSTAIHDSAGNLIATGTAWGNFVDAGPGPDPSPGNGVERPLEPPASIPPASIPPASIPPASVSPLTRIGGLFAEGDGTRLVVPPNSALANKLGVMHGGVQACAIDLAGNAAVSSPEAPMRTASMRINYFRPTPIDGDVEFTAEIVHAGRSMAVARVVSTGADGRVCAYATVTCRRPSSPVETPGCD
ncbi:PaaI family thioesterase [Rhodococcus spongiicola]|uniref:PaaI family thioesterase n=1 Tax=Rhodococcus spongiicola TaxID=2487352 RepID=A0A3S3CQL4_9NOCA|nr:PaaI family thioesterase [Rhodococcus spongiicola]RVW03339.1 PaaI family thioesterase [Rhodococcus spongiicola]